MMKFSITIEGTSPLLMHNGRLANPLDPIVKDLKRYTSKRKKTDEDIEAIAQLEHRAGLYLDPDVGPYIPGDNIHRCLQDAAKKQRLGRAVGEAVLITSDINPISYNGPRDPDELWKDKNHVHMWSVRIQAARTMRCRPIFNQWRTQVEGMLDESIIDRETFGQIVETAGLLIGLGDWRPKHGRFAAKVEKM